MTEERFGESRHSDRIYGGETLPGHAASEGRVGEREFASEGTERAKAKQAEALRNQLAKIEEGIASITASIERVVVSIHAGEKVVHENGRNETLVSLHAKLGEEAQREKVILLEEKAELEREKTKLEEKLMSL